jgi:hypothetical protein
MIFPSLLVFPGFVISWALNLFDFKRRHKLTEYIIAMVVSMAIVPILVYLLYLLTSFSVIEFTLAVFFITYLSINIYEFKKGCRERKIFLATLSHYQRMAILIGVIWVIFSILSLVDIQWGTHLYNNVVSMDFATRVTVINAITRTGVPPVNPSFFSGQVEYITSLYYFWYIICSIVDQFGGNLVDSRMALIAGDAWCGLVLMALIALYIRLRNGISGDKAWITAIKGISLLTISGLDIIPASINMIVTRLSYGFMWPAGDIEHWNEQITAWVGSLFWVPHHIAAMIACLAGLIIFQYGYRESASKKFPIAIITGMALASAVGLSTWVAITFSLFWGVWALFLFIQKKEYSTGALMIFVGLIALIFASPFLLGVIKGGTGGSGLPFVVEVRRFGPVVPYIDWLSTVSENVVYFLLLPVNYMMELGFFFIVGLLWHQQYRNKEILVNTLLIPEMILLCIVAFVCSFVRSAIVSTNDLGWRGWLFGQFILLIWVIDIQVVYPFLTGYHLNNINFDSQKARIKKIVVMLMLIGLSTSIIDVALLRFWPILVDLGISGFPNGLSPDTQLGQRNYSARLAHEFIRDNLPDDIVIQQNPLTGIDRASGLYGTRQIAVSANAPYNVPLPLLEEKIDQISNIFIFQKVKTWESIDLLCQEYYIDVLVVNDLDPLWNSPLLQNDNQRVALYGNHYYAVFSCGSFVFSETLP